MSDKKAKSLDRVIEVAADMFATRQFEEVFINDIAAAARCSTATIYEVYETKETLFIKAIEFYIQGWRPPSPQVVEGALSLLELLGYADTRIRFLADPRTRGLMRAVGNRLEAARPLIQRAVEGQASFEPVLRQTRACMQAGLLRSADAEAVAYSLIAGISFEPIASAVMLGVEAPVSVAEILRKAFIPHVTEAGALELGAYIAHVGANALDPAEILPLSAGTRSDQRNRDFTNP